MDSVATNHFNKDTHPCQKFLEFMSHLANILEYQHFFQDKWTKVIREVAKFAYPITLHRYNSGLYVICIADYLTIYYPSKDDPTKVRDTFNIRNNANDTVFEKTNAREVVFALIML